MSNALVKVMHGANQRLAHKFERLSYWAVFLVVVSVTRMFYCHFVLLLQLYDHTSDYTKLLCFFLLPLLSKSVLFISQNSELSVLSSSRRIHSALPTLIMLSVFYDLPMFIIGILICQHHKNPFGVIVFYFKRKNQISLNLVATSQPDGLFIVYNNRFN